MAAPSGLRRLAQDPIATIAVAAVALSFISLRALRGFPFPGDLHSAAAALAHLAPETVVAALKVWVFWGWSALLIATAVRKLDPEMGAVDSWLMGAAGTIAAAYFLGMILGPLGLFRGLTLWLINLCATAYLWRDLKRPVFHRPDFGMSLALIAIALAAVSLLPLQVGSPVAPYMDVLSWPASAQRVMTFGVYHPFDNDPFGVWGPNVQQPALELFYAYVAMGTHTQLAALAESALIFPMAALIILATYRLAVSLFGDVAGGAAALLIFPTNLLRWIEGMRGTAVAFVLVALGLAWFIDSRRSRVLMAAGALILGVALPSHVIDGALGIGAAIAACLAWLLLARDNSRFKAGILSVAGALLVGGPEFAIARVIVVQVSLLVLAQLAGTALIVLGVSRLCPRAAVDDPRGGVFIARMLLVILMAAILRDIAARDGSPYGEVLTNFTMLGTLAMAGLIVMIVIPPAHDTIGRLCTVAAMLLPAIAIVRLLNWLPLDTSAATLFAKSELSRKIADYWMPFAMMFPAARLVAFGCELLPAGAVVTAVLALLMFPFHAAGGIDFYTHEHSISENWKIDFSILSNGYWISTGNSRWTFGPVEAAVIDTLYKEIAAGRITPRTHVLHLVHEVTPYARWTRFSVFTGINDDPVVVVPTQSEWPMFMVGGRVRPFTDLRTSLATRPPYILSEIPLDESGEIPANEYEVIFNLGRIRLYRLRDGAGATRASGSG